MMFIPAIAVAINQHGTGLANWWAFKRSVTLRFVSVGALMLTQGTTLGPTFAGVRSMANMPA